MTMELIAGAVVALAALFLVLEPLMRPGRMQLAEAELDEDDLLPPEESDSPKMQALIALKEIEFDKATGKLSDEDYTKLKAKYSQMALLAMHAEERGNAPAAPRPATAGASANAAPSDAPTAETEEAGELVGAGVGAAPIADADPAEALIKRMRAGAVSGGAAAIHGTKACPQCGPRPEADAVFCSNCGRALAKSA